MNRSQKGDGKKGKQIMMWGRKEEPPTLTPRERQVLQCVAAGLSSKEAAQELGIAPRTVDRHIENLRHKLRARNKTHMVAKAIASGDFEAKPRKAKGALQT